MLEPRTHAAPATQLSLWSSEEAPPQEWTVRESPRARRMSVRVFYNGRVEVVMPRRTSRKNLDRFLARHRAWIETRRSEARRLAGPVEAFPPRSIDFALTDERWRLHFAGVQAGGSRRLSILETAPSEADRSGTAPRQTPAAGLLTIEGDAADARVVRALLTRWLLGRAREILGPLLANTAGELGVAYKRMSIRRQRTRWGSCSARGTISLNCCTLFQPPAVARYLLIHELAHTLHMNHSRRFWEYVERHCPGYRRLDRELSKGWQRVPAWLLDL